MNKFTQLFRSKYLSAKYVAPLIIGLPLLAVAVFGGASSQLNALADFGSAGYGGSGYGGSTAPTNYKSTFTTSFNGGYATFDIGPTENYIDYAVFLDGASDVTGASLVCNQNSTAITVVPFFSAASATSASGLLTSGTINASDIKQPASWACQPNIHTLPHLVQALREGQISLDLTTSSVTISNVLMWSPTTDTFVPTQTPAPYKRFNWRYRNRNWWFNRW